MFLALNATSQPLAIIIRKNGNSGLRQNRPRVDVLPHLVDGASGNRHALADGLPHRIHSFESRQK